MNKFFYILQIGPLFLDRFIISFEASDIKNK